MSSTYKLTYFDFTGLGEPIRLLLHYGGIQFIDNRISQDDWPKLKPNLPLKQMPILEINGKVMHQSLAISRFIARKVGLAGDSDLEAYEIDAVVDTLNDLRLGIAQTAFEQDPTLKARLTDSLESERLPLWLSKLDEWAKENNGYFANCKLSWADLYFFAIIEYLPHYYGKDFVEGFDNLLKVRENVSNVPEIKKWLEVRPPNNFLKL